MHLTNPHLQPAVDQQWNLTVQQELAPNTTMTLGYVGNKIDHMSDIFLYDQKVLGTGGTVSPAPYAAPLIAAGANVRYNDSSAISRYEALEATFSSRHFHGLDLQASYTWSKCLSNSLGYFGQYGDEEGTGQSQTNGGYFFFQNEYNPRADYGRCITDLSSNFNGYMVYDLPFGKGRQFASGVHPLVNEAIGGWSIASDFTFHTGFAVNVSAPDASGTGSYNSRPNCLPGVDIHGSKQFEQVGGSVGLQYFNTAAVTPADPGTFGNCAVGAFRGPGIKTADLNIIKAFPVREKVNLQFMAQFINLTNTPIFGAPSSSCGPSCSGGISTGPLGGNDGDGSFGLVQSQDPGRENPVRPETQLLTVTLITLLTTGKNATRSGGIFAASQNLGHARTNRTAHSTPGAIRPSHLTPCLSYGAFSSAHNPCHCTTLQPHLDESPAKTHSVTTKLTGGGGTPPRPSRSAPQSPRPSRTAAGAPCIRSPQNRSGTRSHSSTATKLC